MVLMVPWVDTLLMVLMVPWVDTLLNGTLGRYPFNGMVPWVDTLLIMVPW